MDSFEWLRGYLLTFGLHEVDHQNPNRPRTPKFSAHYYYQIIKDNGFPLTDNEEFFYGQFPQHFNWSSASSAYQVSNLDTFTIQCQSALVLH